MPAARRRSIRIGCSGWNYASWKDEFYEGKPARLWLQHYARYFDTVEVNNTFYRLPLESSVARWVAETPSDFLFTIKASRYLTHIKRLTDLRAGLKRYYERVEPLVRSPKLGPVLWQLPPTFKRDDDRLRDALEALPPGRHAFEFRHPDLVREAGLRAAARARRRARDRRPARGQGLPDARAHDRLDVRPFPLRLPRSPRQLFSTPSWRNGLSASRAGAATSRSSRTSTTTGKCSLLETRCG